jgi:hypothetical protein
MEDMPNELVTMIVDLLETKDILSGRVVWSNFAAVGIAKFTRLYIHPTRLREVIEVCNHAHLSKNYFRDCHRWKENAAFLITEACRNIILLARGLLRPSNVTI